jgi:GAF domain-containing protein
MPSAMLLEPMLSRLRAARDIEELLDVAVHDFVALHGAEMGDLQLVGRNGELVIVSARGVNRAFLKVFERVSLDCGSACGQAARDRKPTFIGDVQTDPEFARFRQFAASVPFRTVLSCPLARADGQLLGMLSALSSHPFSPTALEKATAKSYCAQLAATIEKFMQPPQLTEWAEATSAALIQSTPEAVPRASRTQDA